MLLQRKVVSWIMVLLLVIGIFGAVGVIGTAAAETYTVYVVVHGGIGDPYWKKIDNGIQAAAKLYPNLHVHYVGPEMYDFDKFMAYLNSAIAAHPDYLICTITNYKAEDKILRDAMASGIAVAAIDTPDPRPEAQAIPYLTYVGEIPYEGGRLAMTSVLRYFTPKRVMFANHHPGAVNIQDRGRGVGDVCKERGIPFEGVDVGPDPVKAAEITLNYVQAHPDTDLIVTCNPMWGNAVVARFEDAGIKVGKDVKVITWGADDTTMKYIREGKILLSLDEQPYYQGYLSIVYAAMYLQYGFSPPPRVTFEGVWTKAMLPKLLELVDKGIR